MERREHQSTSHLAVNENGMGYQSSNPREGGISKQDLLQRLRANKTRQNGRVVSTTSMPSEGARTSPGGRSQISPTGRPQTSPNSAGRPVQTSLNSTGRPQTSPNPTGRPHTSNAGRHQTSPAFVGNHQVSPTGRPNISPPERPHVSPPGRPQSSSSVTGDLQTGTSPQRKPQRSLSPTGRPFVSPPGRPHPSEKNSITGPGPNTNPEIGAGPTVNSNSVRVEVEVHASMAPDQSLDKIRRRRRSSTQPQSIITSGSPDQQNNDPVAPPRRRYSNQLFPENSPSDQRQPGGQQGENTVKPIPRPRRSQSHDRGLSERKKSESDKEILIKQYDLLQQQKKQQIEKEKQQRTSRAMQKVQLKKELELLSEHERRVVHKLQKFDDDAMTDRRNVNWVRKQQVSEARQQDVQNQVTKKEQYPAEAPNRTVVRQHPGQAQHQHREMTGRSDERQPPQPAERSRRRRSQQFGVSQRPTQEKPSQKIPLPVRPKPENPVQIMPLSVTRHRSRTPQNPLSQQNEKVRLQQDHVQLNNPQQVSNRQSPSGYHDPRGRRSSPRTSEASHSSEDSGEVRLLTYKRRDSSGNIQPTKEHAKPQIKNPVARLSQAFRKGTPSPTPQKQSKPNMASSLKSLLEQTKPASSKKEGITTQEMEEIIKRTAERMKLEQKQMREAEVKQIQERPRRRRRESQEIKTKQETTGNENQVTNMQEGNTSSNPLHTDVTNPQRLQGVKDNPKSESQTSEHEILSGARRGTDESDAAVSMVTNPDASHDIEVKNKMFKKDLDTKLKPNEDNIRKLSAIEEEITPRTPSKEEPTEGANLSHETSNIQSDSEDRALNEAIGLLHELARSPITAEHKSLEPPDEIKSIEGKSSGNRITPPMKMKSSIDKSYSDNSWESKLVQEQSLTQETRTKYFENKSCDLTYPNNSGQSRLLASTQDMKGESPKTSRLDEHDNKILEDQVSNAKEIVTKSLKLEIIDMEYGATTPQGIKTQSLDNKSPLECVDRQASSLTAKHINENGKVFESLDTSLPESVIRNACVKDTRASTTQETKAYGNKQGKDIELGDSQREEVNTIERRHEKLSHAVTPIPEVIDGEAEGIAIRRKRFVKQVSFHEESGKLQQFIGDADKDIPPPPPTKPEAKIEGNREVNSESPPHVTETSPSSPDSPKRGILARGRFSGKRDHPSLSKQTGEMYRRPKSALFDVHIRKPEGLEKKDERGRQRPMSALYISEGDSDPVERGRPLPKHYRPQSDSLMQLDKFDSLQIRPKSRRERSPSPGLRGFSSPVTQRKLRERRRTTQKMLPPPNNTLRMPRQPRPGRMAVIVESLKNGLLDSIRTSNEKLEVMKEHQEETKTTDRSRQGFQYNLDKQIKAAERFIRKLQFHLAKVEELHELYEKELKVREGAVNMVKAYHDAQSPKAKEPVSEAKVGVRDCTQALCHMEAELEANLGAFVLKIEGIAGFARVTRGDVFEITFKYGFQKWKTKCKVEKDLSQTWEGDEIVLYPMVGDFLTIKVTEIRGIARSNVTIGNLEFDTSDFYGSEPQNLTIDVNETGTIKLNIIVTWSPFHVDEEDLKQMNKNSYHRRERTLTDSMVHVHQKRLSTASTSSSSDTPHSPMRPKTKPLEFSSSPTLTLEEALHNVVRLLEILSGQYSELRPLEQQITHLDSFLKKNLDKKRRESTISLSVKNALDSFDFLNEIDEGLSDTLDSTNTQETNRKNANDHVDGFDRLSESSSSCIEEDAPSPQVELRGLRSSPSINSSSTSSSSIKRSSRFLDLSEKRESRMLELNEQRGNRLLESPADSSFGSMKRLPGSDEALTTGAESIDVTLTHHLMFTEYLLSHLGAFGPLKLKETLALSKLQQQAVIIEQLIVLAVSGVHVSSADEVLPELKLNLPLLEFWEQCREKEALYVNADSFLLQLDVKFGAKLRTNHPEIADDVFHSVCNRIIERPADLMNPKTIITLFQYVAFFTQENRRHPEKCLNDITNEFELTASLEPGRPELLRTIKRIPKGFLLPAGNLRALGLLLLEDSATVQAAVRMYLESVAKDDDIRNKAVTVYLECLEERDLSLRQAGCAALAAMQASESFEQLVYLLRCDIDDVKTTAKQALMAFGEEGRLAYEQVSYSPYVAYEQQYTANGTPLMTTEL